MQDLSWFFVIGLAVIVAIAIIIFKIFRGTRTDVITLPAAAFDGAVSVERAIKQRRSIRKYSDKPLVLTDVAQMAWAAQGLTGDDDHGRGVSSAGALYPLETYIVVGNVTGLAAGIYSYHPALHTLTKKMNGDKRKELSDASLSQEWVLTAPASLVLCADYKKTEGKYRERAARYVHIEAGAAAENVYLQAESLGFGTVLVGAFDDVHVQQVLGCAQRIAPLCIMPFGKKQ